MIRRLRALLDDRNGSAAAELALVTPFLLVLLFGALDLGNYFMSEHAVDKAVRDAARYAARLPFSDYAGCDVAAGGAAEQQTQRVARFGDPDGTGTARLPGWTDDSMTTVSIACDDGSGGHDWATAGIYTDFPSGETGPVVTVKATVPYNSLFNSFGLYAPQLNLNAQSQAAVIGA